MYFSWVTQLFLNDILSLTQNFTYLIFIASFFLFALETTSGYLNYVDSFTTIFPNESLINVYYFWWTNPNYVTFFLTSFFMFTFYHFSTSVKLLPVFVLFFTEVWFSEWKDIWNSNVQINVLTTLVPQINLLLLNALNKYHPFILYLSLFSSITLLLILTINFFEIKQFSNSLTTRNKIRWPGAIILINFVALFFGSWWALQEGTWGGWWNWDPSELFGLAPSFILLKVVHSRNQIREIWSSSLLHPISIAITFLTYLTLQLNFELISHNFGPKFFFFFNSNLFSFSLLLLVFLLCNKFLTLMSSLRIRFLLIDNNSSYSKNLPKAVSKAYIQVLPFSILLLWVIISFWDFFNSFLKNFMSVTLTNLEIIGLLNLVLLVTLSSLFSVNTNTNWLPTSLSSITNFFKLSTLPLAYLSVHCLLLYFNFVNLLIDDLSIYKWDFNTTSHSLYNEAALFWSSQSSLVCDSWNVDNVLSKFDSTGYVTLSWSTSNISNTESGNVFTLVLTSTAVDNYYELGLSYVSIFLSIHLPLLTSSTIIAFLLIVIFSFFIRLKLY